MRGKRVFYEGLASMLEAGIPIRQALEHGLDRAPGSLRDALKFLRWQAEQGRPVSEAMATLPRTFSAHEVALFRAGEVSGTLDRECRALAEEEARRERVRSRLLGGLAYPVLVLHLAPMPFAGQEFVRHGLGAALLRWVLWLLPLWAVAGAAFWLHSRLGTTAAWGRAVLAIPGVGGVARDMALVRWARTFAALEDAGVPAESCTEQAAAATGYAPLARALSAPAEAVRRGVSRAEAFRPAPLPPEFHHALSTGETAGSIAASLRAAAESLEHRAEARATAILALVPVVAILIAGVVVAVVAISMVGGAYRGF